MGAPPSERTIGDVERELTLLAGQAWPTPAIEVLVDAHSANMKKFVDLNRNNSLESAILEAAFAGLFWGWLGGEDGWDSAAEAAAAAAHETEKQLIVLDSIFVTIRENRTRLGRLAAKRAGPAPLEIGVEFLETRNSGESIDTIRLWNLSGKAITNATVLVRLVGRDGSQVDNAYYIEKWFPSQVRIAEFESGIARRYFRNTVAEVSSVEVSVYADGGRAVDMTLRRPPEGWPRP